MPNDDYIKRSDARAYVRHAHGKGLNLMECIDAIPAADVEPKRSTGWWMPGDYVAIEHGECVTYPGEGGRAWVSFLSATGSARPSSFGRLRSASSRNPVCRQIPQSASSEDMTQKTAGISSPWTGSVRWKVQSRGW